MDRPTLMRCGYPVLIETGAAEEPMSTPQPPGSGESDPAEKATPEPRPGLDFDPYRFGLPEHPVPPEYAPPGYVFPSQPAPAPPAAGPWAPPAALPPTQAGSGPPGPLSPPPYPQYPHYPYGAPPPPPYHGYYQPKPGNGKAVAALVLGILSIVFFWLTVFDLALIIPAVVFGTLGLSDARTRNAGGRGKAIAGLVCAAVGTAIVVIFTIIVVHAANQCGGLSHSSDPGFEQCLRDKLGGS
jgi:hypothetical protein